jgi:uncharacterized protein YbaA (DUF1428 family)
MTYIDGMIAAVPTANKAQFVEHSRAHAAVLKEFGAESVVDAGATTFPTARRPTSIARSRQRPTRRWCSAG